jgi:hypothetical protein
MGLLSCVVHNSFVGASIANAVQVGYWYYPQVQSLPSVSAGHRWQVNIVVAAAGKVVNICQLHAAVTAC